jgi:CRP-like cAMP-binding protein
VASQFLKTVQKGAEGDEPKSKVPKSTRLKLAAAITRGGASSSGSAQVHTMHTALPPIEKPPRAIQVAQPTHSTHSAGPNSRPGSFNSGGSSKDSGKGSAKLHRRRSSSLLSMVGLADRPDAPEATIEARVSEYFAHYDAHAKKLDEQQVLAVGISPHIVSSIRLDVMGGLVGQSYLFQHCTESFVADVTAELRQEFYSKKSVIVEAKQQSSGIYFIKAGIVTIKRPLAPAAFLAPAFPSPSEYKPSEMGLLRRPSFSHGLPGLPTAAQNHVRGENRHKGEVFAESTLLRVLSSHGLEGDEEMLEVLAATDCEVWVLDVTRFQSLLQRHSHLIGTTKNPALMVCRAIEMQRKLSGGKDGGRNEGPSNGQGRAGAGGRSGINLQTIKDIRARQASGKSLALIVLPGSPVTTALTAAVVFYTMFFFVSIPTRLAFNQGYGLDWFLCFDYLGDTMFVADMVLQARFLAFWKDGDLVSDPQELFKHYTSGSHVWCHAAAALPLDLLILAGPVSSLGPLQTLMLYRLPKLLRLTDLNDRLTALLRNLTAMLGGGVKLVDSNVFSLSKLILMMVMTNLLGCVFFIIANQQHLRGNTNNWADAAGVLQECSLGSYSPRNGWNTEDPALCVPELPSGRQMYSQCVHSVYWAITVLTGVGYGDIVPLSEPERLYNILFFLVGTLIFAVLIAYLSDIVSQLDVTSNIFKTRVAKLQSFLLREKALEETQSLAMKHMNRLWSAGKGATGTEIISFLPRRLYRRVIECVLGTEMPKVFFFRSCPQAFRDAFVESLTVSHYVAGDYLFHSGEASSKLFLLFKGEVSLVSLDEEKVERQSRSSSFASNASSPANSPYGSGSWKVESSTLSPAGFGGGAHGGFQTVEPTINEDDEEEESGKVSAGDEEEEEEEEEEEDGDDNYNAVFSRGRGTADKYALSADNHAFSAPNSPPSGAFSPTPPSSAPPSPGNSQRTGLGSHKMSFQFSNTVSRQIRGTLQMQMDKKQDRKTATSYQKFSSGFVGEAEFFTRMSYSCCAKAETDAVVFEVSRRM